MLDRTSPPAFQKNTSFTLIQPEKISLPNGLILTLVPGGEQEVVKIEFIFKAGKWYEPVAGVSYFTAQLLQKGTATKNSFQISGEFDQLGAHVEVSPGFDFTSLALFGLSKNVNRFFELLYEIITQPSFPAEELQQIKDIYIQGLKINLEKTSYLASRQLRKILFGGDHPYGHDAEISDVEKLTRSQLIDFHKTNFNDLEIICSGKLDESTVQELVKIFGRISRKPVFEKKFEKSQPNYIPSFLEKQNTVQSSIRLGKSVIGRTHPDYPAILLLNHVLGGFFGSRLMKNIREEKGLTYGIYSSISSLKYESFMSIGADVNRENRELVIQEIKSELQKLCSQPVSSAELEITKNHFIGSLQAEITTPFAHADKLKNIILHSLPHNFYQELILAIAALTAHDLQRVAQQYFEGDSFSVVAAG